MKVGIQTISWGAEPGNAIEMLSAIEHAGFEGIELAQTEDDFVEAELLQSIQASQLELVGVAGGRIEDKVSLVARYLTTSSQSSVPYIYADRWDNSLQERFESVVAEIGLDQELKIGLHPHMYKPIQTSADALELLEQYPKLSLLPDVAHLTIAKDDIFSLFRNHLNRICAVHLKDWSPKYGYSFQFYSRGFVELGVGEVDLMSIIGLLKKLSYRGWIIVEQDSSQDPVASALQSREFLQSHGI